MKVANDDSSGVLLQLWERAMCSRDARVAARAIIDNALKSAIVSGEELLRVMWDLVTKPNNCTHPQRHAAHL